MTFGDSNCMSWTSVSVSYESKLEAGDVFFLPSWIRYSDQSPVSIHTVVGASSLVAGLKSLLLLVGLLPLHILLCW